MASFQTTLLRRGARAKIFVRSTRDCAGAKAESTAAGKTKSRTVPNIGIGTPLPRGSTAETKKRCLMAMGETGMMRGMVLTRVMAEAGVEAEAIVRGIAKITPVTIIVT